MGVADRILDKHSGLAESVVVVDSTDLVDIRLVDQNRVHTHGGEGVEHAAVVGKLVGIPFEATHVGLLAIPIEVKHYSVYRIVALTQGIDGTESLLLVVITVARGDVAECPEWRELLTSGKLGEARGRACERAFAVDKVI